MKRLLASLPAFLLLMTGWAQAAVSHHSVLGLVGEDVVPDTAHPAAIERGVRVLSLLPGGAAERAGVEAGDVIVMLDGKPVYNKAQLATLLSKHAAMETVRVEFMRRGHLQVTNVRLMLSPSPAAKTQSSLETAVGGDRVPRPLNLTPQNQERIRELHNAVCAQLALLPNEIDTAKLTDIMQAIRDHACEVNEENGRDTVQGRAGEIIVRLRDNAGSVMLRGANNLLMVEIFDCEGRVLYHSNIDTPEQRAAIPAPFLQRLKSLH